MVALVIGGADLYFKTPILEIGDVAVNSLQIDNARHGTEIYGNYSRFQFNHPGPALFYVYAGGEIVLHDWLGLVPSPHNAQLLASLLIQVACFSLAVAIVHSWIGSWTFVALALLGGVWHFSLARSAFTSIWPPHVLLMPFLCFITSASSFAAGRRWDLVLMVVTGGLLFHGHVAQPLFVGGLGSLACFLHYRRLKATAGWVDGRNWLRGNRPLVTVCGGLVLLFLLPLAIDLILFGVRSNVSTIVRRIIINTEESKGALQSLLYFLSFATYADNQENRFTKLGPESYQFFREHLAVLSAWFIFLALPAAFAVWHRKRLSEATRHFLGAAYPILGVTVLLCVMWGKMQAGPMMQFNGYFYFGIYYFAGLLSIGVVCSIPGRLLPVPVTAALCGVAGISASWLFRAPRLNEDESGLTLRQGVETALVTHAGQRPVLLVFEHYAWPEAASVGLELQRRGVPFYVASGWNFMFGRRHDLHLLGEAPERKADVWWITNHGPGGVTISSTLQIFTKPATVDPNTTQISFALRANGFRYLINGLSAGNIEYAWTNDQLLSFKLIPLPTSADVRLVLDTKISQPPGAPDAQVAEVRFNGQLVGAVTVSQHEQPAVTVPRALWNSEPEAVLELRFPRAFYSTSFTLPANDRWSALGLWEIRFESMPAK